MLPERSPSRNYTSKLTRRLRRGTKIFTRVNHETAQLMRELKSERERGAAILVSNMPVLSVIYKFNATLIKMQRETRERKKFILLNFMSFPASFLLYFIACICFRRILFRPILSRFFYFNSFSQIGRAHV